MASGGERRRPRSKTTAIEGLVKLPDRDDMSASPTDVAPRDLGVPPAEQLCLGRMVETNGGSSLENVPGFDRARARNLGLLPRTLAPCSSAAGPDGFAFENVIGDDNLVPVPDTTGLPWRCIVMLTITYQSGARATGTAWFMGERALGTAGHNIFDPRYGHATEILASPGFDGAAAPLGTYRVSVTYCDPAWLAGSADPAMDYGVLMLPDPSAGRRLGWFGFAAYDDRQLERLLLNVSGYPARRALRTQHYNGGRVDEVDRQFIRYTFDTVGGMSGAPLFALFGEQRVVVAIHTSGNDRANRARRIDRSLYEVLRRFS